MDHNHHHHHYNTPTNTDYLSEESPSFQLETFPDPPIKRVVYVSTSIRDANTGDYLRNERGEKRVFGRVMVKNGLTSTFDVVYGNIRDNANAAAAAAAREQRRGGGGGASASSSGVAYDNDDGPNGANNLNQSERESIVSDESTDDVSTNSSSSSSFSSSNDMDTDTDALPPPQEPEHAYLYEPSQDRHICKALYGNVFSGTVLQRRPPNTNTNGNGDNDDNDDDDWETTGERCAIKAMPWKAVHYRLEVERRLENPRNEMGCMWRFRTFYDETIQQQQQQLLLQGNGNTVVRHSAREAMKATNVIIPLDFLYDDRFLYIIMPLCEGGELFDVQGRENFSEEVCRTVFLPQMLNGLRWMQRARLCHRDISLENYVLMDGDGEMRVVLIDMGMAIGIPYGEDGRRRLVSSQPQCGKISYMSPEIYQMEPFDGHAVDLWAIGVVLFCLITGRHPWEHSKEKQGPNVLNRYYRHMTGGHLVTIVRNSPSVQMSEDAMDLLQSMLRSDTRYRLCLEQILQHRWLNEVH